MESGPQIESLPSAANTNEPVPLRRADPAGRLCGQRTLVELLLAPRDAGAIGFALAQVKPEGRVLWIQDRMTTRQSGLPAPEALARFGIAPDRLVLVRGRRPRDVLWAMEEGLRCAALGGILGELWGDSLAVDFTATKRLAIRAERQGIPVFLVRFAATPALSAARQRWRIESLPSSPHPDDPKAPGAPRWRADLFRVRGARPGLWEACYDPAAHRLDLVPPFRHAAVAAAPSSEDAAGTGGAARARA